MTRHGANKLRATLLACCGSALLVGMGVAMAGPLGLPDSARPGAVRPEQTGKPTVPPEPAGEVMEIPAVIDRPLDINAGPRILVNSFRLQDARDIPDADLDVAAIDALLEEKRRLGPDGFTIGQMQEIANSVSQFYREHGLILAQAVVPVQNVDGGVVIIQVFEGLLGRVLTENNRMYDSAVLQEPFNRLIGQPVRKEQIEAALLQLTDFPGLTIFGVFQPGQQIGQSDIVLRVQEENRFDVAFRIDNHGVPETGRVRFNPTVEWNNITGGADRLTLTVQQAYNPKSNNFKSVEYEHYLVRGITGGFWWNRNNFDVGGELKRVGITGQSEQMAAWFEKDWLRSRQLNLSSQLSLASKRSDSKTRGESTNRDRLAVLTLGSSIDYVDTRFKGLNFATAEYSRGFNDVIGAMGSGAEALDLPGNVRPGRRGQSGRFASGQFDKAFLTGSRLQTVTRNTTLLVRAEYQWASDLLVPMEQYSVGGPDNVRAFGPAEILFDRALFASAELIQRMPFITDVEAFSSNRTWGDLVQLSVFYDHAVGRLNDPLSSQPQGHLNFKGAGVQARFTMPNFIEARLMWAWPMGADRINPSDASAPLNDRRPQIWGDLTYSF